MIEIYVDFPYTWYATGPPALAHRNITGRFAHAACSAGTMMSGAPCDEQNPSCGGGRRRPFRRGLAVVGCFAYVQNVTGNDDATCHLAVRRRLVTPTFLEKVPRGGETGLNKVDEEWILEEFEEQATKVRKNIQEDALGEVERLRRAILIRRVRNAQKRRKRQAMSQRGKEAIEDDNPENDTVETPATRQSVPIQDKLEEEDMTTTLSEGSPPKAPDSSPQQNPGSSNILEGETDSHDSNVSQAGESNLDTDNVEDLMDASLDWLDEQNGLTSSEADPVEKIDVFNDFVVGESDEDEQDVLHRLDAAETVHVSDAPMPKQQNEADTDDNSRVRIRKITTEQQEGEEEAVPNPGNGFKEAEGLVTPSGGITSKIKKKKKATKKSKSAKIVRPPEENTEVEQSQPDTKTETVLDDDDSDSEDSSKEAETGVADQNSTAVLFIKTMGLSIVMLLLCFVLGLFYDYIVAKIVVP